MFAEKRCFMPCFKIFNENVEYIFYVPPTVDT